MMMMMIMMMIVMVVVMMMVNDGGGGGGGDDDDDGDGDGDGDDGGGGDDDDDGDDDGDDGDDNDDDDGDDGDGAWWNRLRSAAAVCSRCLPLSHGQSHSHGTCSSFGPNRYAFGVDDVVVMMLMMMSPEAPRQGVTEKAWAATEARYYGKGLSHRERPPFEPCQRHSRRVNRAARRLAGPHKQTVGLEDDDQFEHMTPPPPPKLLLHPISHKEWF